MATRKQHFVPKVYLKAWGKQVKCVNGAYKGGNSVYIFENNSYTGRIANIKSILWKPHLYTIGFDYFFIAKSCPKIYSDFVNMVFNRMRDTSPQPVYGKLGHSIIKTKESVRKHLPNIDDWEFYYYDGKKARQNGIQNQIKALNCYILEDAFDDCYEKQWEQIYSNFIDAVHKGKPVAIGRSERIIPMNIAIKMLDFFFMLLCRSPQFDAMGIYTRIKKNILYPIFKEMYNNGDELSQQEIEEAENKSRESVCELMVGIWFSELYKMLFKSMGGFYHEVLERTQESCQMILFETYDDAGNFITSDNPAFEHISFISASNSNGFVFPITPQHLLFIAKGTDAINIVDYRFANSDTVKHFNSIIKQHKMELLIASEKMLDKFL